MEQYWYVMTDKGHKPSFKHETYGSAEIEAKRLLNVYPHVNSVEILECKGVVKRVEVPVTRTEIQVFKFTDDLPF